MCFKKRINGNAQWGSKIKMHQSPLCVPSTLLQTEVLKLQLWPGRVLSCDPLLKSPFVQLQTSMNLCVKSKVHDASIKCD